MAQVYHLTGRCMRRSIIAAVASRETGVAIDADLAAPASAGCRRWPRGWIAFSEVAATI
jgi:hypothetical protein